MAKKKFKVPPSDRDQRNPGANLGVAKSYFLFAPGLEMFPSISAIYGLVRAIHGPTICNSWFDQNENNPWGFRKVARGHYVVPTKCNVTEVDSKFGADKIVVFRTLCRSPSRSCAVRSEAAAKTLIRLGYPDILQSSCGRG